MTAKQTFETGAEQRRQMVNDTPSREKQTLNVRGKAETSPTCPPDPQRA